MQKTAWFKVFISMIILLILSSHSTTQAQEELTADVTAPEIRAVISPMISYQGRLVENGIPANGVRKMDFSIETTGEVEIWSMEMPAVSVSNGLFQVNLGPFGEGIVSQMGQDLWLKVVVEGTPLPRQQLMGAPYAFSLVPGATVNGTTAVPMFSVSNGLGIGIKGNSEHLVGVQGLSSNNFGLEGRSTYSSGVYGESNNSHGVFAFGYAPNVSALYAGSGSPEGIAILGLVDSTKAAIVTKNGGSGPLLEGYAGDTDEFTPEFIIQNDGSVKQELGASGLVKAGALLYCAKTDSEIYRQFNNVIGATPISIIDTGITGQCEINPGFDLSNSYWVVTNPDPTSDIISCSIYHPNRFMCTRFDTNGDVVDGKIMLLFY